MMQIFYRHPEQGQRAYDLPWILRQAQDDRGDNNYGYGARATIQAIIQGDR